MKFKYEHPKLVDLSGGQPAQGHCGSGTSAGASGCYSGGSAVCCGTGGGQYADCCEGACPDYYCMVGSCAYYCNTGSTVSICNSGTAANSGCWNGGTRG
jgi:hypothetical protein